MLKKVLVVWCLIGSFGIAAATEAVDGEKYAKAKATAALRTDSDKAPAMRLREAGARSLRETAERVSEATGVRDDPVREPDVQPAMRDTKRGVPPVNDACASQLPISGDGLFAFNNANATTDGANHAACEFHGEQGIAKDIWYCWTAPVDGTAKVETCDQTDVDTKMAAYDGCACPAADPRLLACDDDACFPQSLITFTVTGGQQYLIRLGTRPGTDGGEGTFRVSVLPCSEPDENCQARDPYDANNSNGLSYAVAEGFSPAQSGDVAEVCWWGTYFDGWGDCQGEDPDTFEVKYYLDANGFPGTLIGSFSQSAGTLTVEGPVDTGEVLVNLAEYEYKGLHAPVSVIAGACHWIEITNSVSGGGCIWFWEFSEDGDNRIVQDGDPMNGYGVEDVWQNDQAFCLNLPLGDAGACLPPPPVNDNCADAIDIFDGLTYFETTNATTDGPAEPGCNFPENDDQINQDIWFDYVATCDASLQVSLCASRYDTKLAVYDGTDCPPAAEPLACNDDFCGPPELPLLSQVTLPVTLGQTYKIRVGGYKTDFGPGSVRVTCAEPPSNDDCEDATIEPLAMGSSFVSTGTTQNATNDCDLFLGAEVWVAFDLLEDASVTIDYAGTDPAFEDAWLNIALECPCTEDITGRANCIVTTADDNYALIWDCLPAGIYYYPVLADEGSMGPYTIEVSATACVSDPCAGATGDCFYGHMGRGCEDPELCGQVCAIDPFCCCQWDDICANEATALSVCATATGDCCAANDNVGCETYYCCTAVCFEDSYCCSTAWDSLCASEAEEYCGQLCDNCGDGDVTFVDPPDGFVDARQPHPIANASTLLGVSQFIVQAPENAEFDGGACWLLCETNNNPGVHPGLTPNSIVDVSNDGGGTYTITLARPIAHGEMTTITYDTTAGGGSTIVTGTFHYLPADANADGTSAPADVLAVIDSLNGVTPLPASQVDMDRDGTPAPADILRVIDLLNGAGVFEPFVNVTIDETGCP